MLSIREEEGKNLIKELCGREAEVLGDPTLYLKVDQWRKIEKKVKLPRKNYLLVYFLGDCITEYKDKIVKEAEKRNLEIYWLQSQEHYDIAPDEFLYLIDHAECVCTDSFHGTVFSIIFQRPFLIFQRKEKFVDMSSRLRTLFNIFALGSRDGIYKEANSEFFSDFKQTAKILKEQRKKIEIYLKKIGRKDAGE